MKRVMVIALVGLLMINSGCGDDDNAVVEIRERMAVIRLSIDMVIEDKTCNGAGDCASIAFGSKPCGGPWEYLIYAPGNVDDVLLQELVDEYNQLEKEVNELTTALSDCEGVEPAELECREDVCVGMSMN